MPRAEVLPRAAGGQQSAGQQSVAERNGPEAPRVNPATLGGRLVPGSSRRVRGTLLTCFSHRLVSMIWLTSSCKTKACRVRGRPSRGRQVGPNTHHFDQLGHGHLELDDDGVRDVLYRADELVVVLEESRVQPVLGLGAAAACGARRRDVLHLPCDTPSRADVRHSNALLVGRPCAKLPSSCVLRAPPGRQRGTAFLLGGSS